MDKVPTNTPLYIPFTNDAMFCTILSDPKLCKKFLEVVLNVKIWKIEYPEGQKTISHTLDAKSVRLDVYVEDEEHTVYDIEMQTTKNKNLRKRSRYYQGSMDLSILKHGMDYKKLKQSFVIFICPFDPFGEDEYIYRFTHQCTLSDGTQFELGDGATVVFVNAAGHKGNVSSEFKNLMNMILTDQPSDEFTNELKDAVIDLNNDAEWRRAYMTLEMKYNEIRDATREDALIEGEEKGIVKGEAKGIIKGKVLAYVDLIHNGIMSVEQAASFLHLSVNEFIDQARAYDQKI